VAPANAGSITATRNHPAAIAVTSTFQHQTGGDFAVMGAPLNAFDKVTFYGGGAKGYTDYPTLGAAQAAE
jgi:hypothetical protein